MQKEGHRLQLHGRSSHGKDSCAWDDRLLATVDSNLDVFNAEGHHFARIGCYCCYCYD